MTIPQQSDLPPGTASADEQVVMIRSEERLRPRTELVPTRTARLEKYVVTEQRTITVEVRHEEVRLVYDDLPTGAHAAGPQDAASRRAPEFVLSEERVEVRKVVVPVERVRLVVDTVTEQREVTDSVRSERIVAESTVAGADGRVDGS